MPTRILRVLVLLLISVLGSSAQVSHSVSLLSSPRRLTIILEDTFDDGTSNRNSRPRYSRDLYLGISSMFYLNA